MQIAFSVASVVLIVLAVPYLGRIWVGPTLFDRLVGLNSIGTMLPLLLVLIGWLHGRLDMFVDFAIGILLLNFYTTLLIARYFKQKRREQSPP